MWRWDQGEPFGNDVPNGDPNNTGNVFDLPLRLPGQYYDRETAIHYNTMRDYDPSIGRYVESDPIGLRGGLDTYAYGNLAPLMYSDASGLAVWFCTRHMRDSNIPIANHGYFFDDKTGRCCGDPGYGAKDPLKTCRDRGPKKDSCILISSSDSDTEKLLQCCNKKTNENDYWPFFNDCMNVGDDCIREIGMAPLQLPTSLDGEDVHLVGENNHAREPTVVGERYGFNRGGMAWIRRYIGNRDDWALDSRYLRCTIPVLENILGRYLYNLRYWSPIAVPEVALGCGGTTCTYWHQGLFLLDDSRRAVLGL